jgi:hypothetical protein
MELYLIELASDQELIIDNVLELGNNLSPIVDGDKVDLNLSNIDKIGYYWLSDRYFVIDIKFNKKVPYSTSFEHLYEGVISFITKYKREKIIDGIIRN